MESCHIIKSRSMKFNLHYTLPVSVSCSVHHYSIEKRLDGQFMIAEGKPFPGPLELIEHHKTTIDGFVTKPTKPCNRAKFQPAIAFRGMTYTDLENELLKKAEKMKVCPDWNFIPLHVYCLGTYGHSLDFRLAIGHCQTTENLCTTFLNKCTRLVQWYG